MRSFTILFDNFHAFLYATRLRRLIEGKPAAARFPISERERCRAMADPKELVEDENKIDTVIADDISFRGSLKFKNSLKIKGAFEGKIETEGQLIVGREAKVSAEIRASEVTLSGIFNGKIKATKKIELLKKSKTNGDLIAPDVSIEPGSLFNGTCIMDEKS